ncbi:hypothetical protein BJV82DRAFT_597988 [Fennellomyces sp. T-0311]|nr:hypothetical protein BJV82DRAFT_597988 [Fennellomyces sp. T-0311]
MIKSTFLGILLNLVMTREPYQVQAGKCMCHMQIDGPFCQETYKWMHGLDSHALFCVRT